MPSCARNRPRACWIAWQMRPRRLVFPARRFQVENAQPHQAIIAAAEDKGCDLIVMSSHGRSGLSMLLIGSVTNKVLTQAKTPPTGLSVNGQTARWIK